MINGLSVAVIGGGPAGLSTALALAMQGASVCVFEQASQLGDIGAGLQISPNGARALGALGLAGALDRVGMASDAVVPTDGLSGKPVTRFDLTRQDPRYRFVKRPDLVTILADGCRDAGVEVRLGSRVESPGEFDLIVGADGIHSTVRQRLNGVDRPIFTGHVAWRAIIRQDTDAEARIWMLPRRHVVTYPLPGGLLNIVAVQERRDWAAEGWNHPDEPGQVQDAFSDGCASLRHILNQIDAVNLWGLFRHPVASIWHDADHCLVGDAAHPTLPFLAQGANLALEDAVVLARCLSQNGLSGLARYQAERAPRVARAIKAAQRNAANYHLSGLRRTVAFAGLSALGRLAPDAFVGRLDWLYGFKP